MDFLSLIKEIIRGLCITARLHAVCAGRRVWDTHRPAPKEFLRNKNNRLMGISKPLSNQRNY